MSNILDARPLGLTIVRLVVNGTVVRVGIVILATKLLKSLAGSLRDQESGEAAEKHEEGVDLEDVIHPGSLVLVGGTVGAEDRDGTLADDGTDLARGGRDTVGGGTVAGRKDLSGNNEGGSVGAWLCQLSALESYSEETYRS